MKMPRYEVMQLAEEASKEEKQKIRWSQYKGYEVNTRTDRRFSPFVCRVRDGRSIEVIYQCDIKGYAPGGTDWRLGKGKPPLKPVDLWAEYLALYREWAAAHPELMEELRTLAAAHGNMLCDRFATTTVNQARALATILNGD